MRFETLLALPLRGCALIACAWLVACGPPVHGPEDCGIPPLVFDPDGTLQGSAGDDTCARVERSPQQLPPDTICKACPFDLHRVLVVRDGEGFDVTSADRLEYEESHHNWRDVMRAETDDGRVLRLTFEYLVEGPLDEASSWDLVLELLGEGDEILDGPVSLALKP
jgi:hypothetical protein